MSERHYRRDYPQLNDRGKFLHLVYYEGGFSIERIRKITGASRRIVIAAMEEYGVTTADLMKACLMQTKEVHSRRDWAPKR